MNNNIWIGGRGPNKNRSNIWNPSTANNHHNHQVHNHGFWNGASEAVSQNFHEDISFDQVSNYNNMFRGRGGNNRRFSFPHRGGHNHRSSHPERDSRSFDNSRNSGGGRRDEDRWDRAGSSGRGGHSGDRSRESSSSSRGQSRESHGHKSNYRGKNFDPFFKKGYKHNDDKRKRSSSNDKNENVRKPKKAREDLTEPKEKLDEADKLIKKQLEKNLKENKSTSSDFASRPVNHDHGECSQEENIAPNLVKIDKTRVKDISLTKEDLANIGQGRLRTNSEREMESQSKSDHPYPCAQGRTNPEEKSKSKEKQRLAGEPSQKRNEKVKNPKDKTEKRKEKPKESIRSPSKSPKTVIKEKENVDLKKFKESLVKMDPSHLRDLIENPRNAKPNVRKNFEELIKVSHYFFIYFICYN